MRAQVSLEYITTYAWAIVIIVVIVGSLIYFGRMETSRNSETICNLGPQFSCQDVYITEEGYFGVKFINQINDNISMNISIENFPSSVCSVNPLEIGIGKEGIISCDLGEDVFGGDIENVETKISFMTKRSVDELGQRKKFVTHGKVFTNVEKNLVDKANMCDSDRDGFWVVGPVCNGVDCNDNDPNIVEPRCFSNSNCSEPTPICVNDGECNSFCFISEITCPPYPQMFCDWLGI